MFLPSIASSKPLDQFRKFVRPDHVRTLPARWMLFMMLLGAACGTPSPNPYSAPSRAGLCVPIAGIPGPEDLIVDGKRLLVSSHDRRAGDVDGEIFSLPAPLLGPRPEPKPLELIGRDDCSFRPHGLSLVRRSIDPGGEPVPLLHVVNHHRAEDAVPATGCLAEADEPDFYRRPFTSIEIFIVESRGLRFLRRLADPAVLANGNDLVALANGDIYVTSPPRNSMKLALEAAGVWKSSSVIRISCWPEMWPGSCSFFKVFGSRGKLFNGIVHRSASPDDPGRLFVSATFEQRLYELDLAAPTERQLLVPLADGTIPLGLDNLSWAEGDDLVLLAAGSDDLRRLAQHANSEQASSPSALWRLAITPDGMIERRKLDLGALINGASVVVELEDGGGWVVGQAFGGHVFHCSDPRGKSWRTG